MPFDKDAGPGDSLCVNVDSIAVHQVIGPVAFIGRSISIDHLPKAFHDSVLPRAAVAVSRCETISALAMHLIIYPLAIISLSSNLFTSAVGGTRKCYPSTAVLDLAAIFQ